MQAKDATNREATDEIVMGLSNTIEQVHASLLTAIDKAIAASRDFVSAPSGSDRPDLELARPPQLALARAGEILCENQLAWSL